MTDNYIIIASQRQANIEAAKAAFLASGGEVKQVQGFRQAPRKRSDWVDPDTVLKRKKPAISRSEREALRKMASELEGGK